MNSPQADIFLLAAGLGTRLRPLTEKTPKPLIEVAGKPLIAWNLEMIARSGFKKAIVNLHYLPDALRSFLGDGSKWGLEIRYSEESTLLDTGGGIKNIEPLLEHETLVTVNSDTLLSRDFTLADLLKAHGESSPSPLATLMLREDKDVAQYGTLGIDGNARICEFLDKEYIKVLSRSA